MVINKGVLCSLALWLHPSWVRLFALGLTQRNLGNGLVASTLTTIKLLIKAKVTGSYYIGSWMVKLREVLCKGPAPKYSIPCPMFPWLPDWGSMLSYTSYATGVGIVLEDFTVFYVIMYMKKSWVAMVSRWIVILSCTEIPLILTLRSSCKELYS